MSLECFAFARLFLLTTTVARYSRVRRPSYSTLFNISRYFSDRNENFPLDDGIASPPTEKSRSFGLVQGLPYEESSRSSDWQWSSEIGLGFQTVLSDKWKMESPLDEPSIALTALYQRFDAQSRDARGAEGTLSRAWHFRPSAGLAYTNIERSSRRQESCYKGFQQSPA